MGMFNHVTSLKPQVDENQSNLLMKSMTKSFNEYAHYYQAYINGRGHELVYSSSHSPETYTNIAEWLHHLVGEHVHHGEGGEPLLDISSITKDEYTEALENFADDNENRTLDNTASDMSNIGIGNMSSTPNKSGADGTHLKDSNSTIIEAETQRGLNTEDPRHTAQASTSQGTTSFQSGALGLMSTGHSAATGQYPYGPLLLDPLLRP